MKTPITRLVKMTFAPENIETFLALFEANKEKIAAFPGCNSVALKRDISDERIFFTISFWESEEALNTYRNSELFASVWAKTKILFAAKPDAWSLA
jgi:(4S)-4-hydroxy-5-phosphonooxypentane-2,3-dione isomerase